MSSPRTPTRNMSWRKPVPPYIPPPPSSPSAADSDKKEETMSEKACLCEHPPLPEDWRENIRRVLSNDETTSRRAAIAGLKISVDRRKGVPFILYPGESEDDSEDSIPVRERTMSQPTCVPPPSMGHPHLRLAPEEARGFSAFRISIPSGVESGSPPPFTSVFADGHGPDVSYEPTPSIERDTSTRSSTEGSTQDSKDFLLHTPRARHGHSLSLMSLQRVATTDHERAKLRKPSCRLKGSRRRCWSWIASAMCLRSKPEPEPSLKSKISAPMPKDALLHRKI